MPAATPVIKPAVETVATEVLLEPQVTTRSVTTVPFASFTVIVGVEVPPTNSGILAGARVTLPTGTGVTVMVADPLFPSLVAVIVVVPTATAVTTPDDDTVAVAGVLELHATGRSVTTVPFSSLTDTVKLVVSPVATLAVGGETVTVPTGTGITFTEIVPLLPSLVAVMTDVPSATPDTTPAEETVATVVVAEPHVTARPVTTFPLASFKTGLSVAVLPMTTDAVGDANVTVATGGSVTVATDDPLFPSLVAVIVAVPAPTAVTDPLDDTVATVALLVSHVTTRSVTTVPWTFFTVADSGIV